MTLTQTKNPRLMIVVLPDQDAAFAAYQFLWHQGIPPQNLALVGKGYSSPEHVGLIEPKRIAQSCAFRTSAVVAILLSTCAAVVWQVDQWRPLLARAMSSQLNHFQGLMIWIGLGLIFGSILGAVLGFFYGVFFKSSVSIACRKCLKRGQYLLLLEGSELLVAKASTLLWQSNNLTDD
ncbi:MAG: hypothetical protein SFT94_11660 [Pseudanabaenaceae cyanobacterium bins.68]|nr:hypothetical protein [Pseudanabaenaceae cyanobacterium bins.68]